ncbi:hypothetical protein MMC14_004144 [Varicellaria rhodocarpa]|nr:hypothetical protein [Varicellaria rhodocarpa]
MTDPEPNFKAVYASNSSAPVTTSSSQPQGGTYVVDHVIELSAIKYLLASIINNRLPSGPPFTTLNIPQDTFTLLGQEWSTIGVEKKGTPVSTLMTIMGSHEDDTNLQVLEATIRGLKARRLLTFQEIVGVFNYLNSPAIQSTARTVYANINTALAAFEVALEARDQIEYDVQGAWREFFLDVSRNMEMNAQMFILKRMGEEQMYWYVKGEGEEEEEEEESLARFALDGYAKLAGEISTSIWFDTRWLEEPSRGYISVDA